jgi:hypothetical protein
VSASRFRVDSGPVEAEVYGSVSTVGTGGHQLGAGTSLVEPRRAPLESVSPTPRLNDRYGRRIVPAEPPMDAADRTRWFGNVTSFFGARLWVARVMRLTVQPRIPGR